MTDEAPPLPLPRNSVRLPFYRRFGFKVVSAFLVLVLTAMGVSAYVSVRIASDGFSRVVRDDFQGTLSFNANFLAAQGENWTNWVRHLTIDEYEHGLGDAIRSGRRDLVADYIKTHLPSAFSGAATVADRNGRVLYRAHAPDEFGDTLGHINLVRAAFERGEINVAVVNEQNRFMLYAAAPVMHTGKPEGVLMIGNAVDNAFVEHIKRNTDVELAVVRDRAVMGSTLRAPNGGPIGDLPIPYLEYKMLLTHPDRVLETRFLGERYFVAASPISMMDGNTPGSLFLAVPRKRLDRAEAEIYSTFLILMGVITAMTAIVGVIISRTLTHPISRLTGQVEHITHGGAFEPIDHSSRDEVGLLADSFNDMQESIRTQNAELKAYSENLEELVRDRTQDLQAATMAAQESSQSKTRFLTSMSHELRTPLNAIIGFSELMSAEGFAPVSSEKASHYGSIIHTAGHHLLELINEILDLAKVESGRQELSEETFIFESEIHAAVRMVREQATRNDITINIENSATIPELNADKMRFKQIIINLLSNAIKFTSDGGTIDVIAQTEDNGELHILIKDTGAGIPAAEIKTVLEPFGQASTEVTRKSQGTGLGLPLCKSLMALHGGSLQLESEVDVGTTVHLYFPANRSGENFSPNKDTPA